RIDQTGYRLLALAQVALGFRKQLLESFLGERQEGLIATIKRGASQGLECIGQFFLGLREESLFVFQALREFPFLRLRLDFGFTLRRQLGSQLLKILRRFQAYFFVLPPNLYRSRLSRSSSSFRSGILTVGLSYSARKLRLGSFRSDQPRHCEPRKQAYNNPCNVLHDGYISLESSVLVRASLSFPSKLQFSQRHDNAMTCQLSNHCLIRSDQRVSHLLSVRHIESIVNRSLVGPGDGVGFAQYIILRWLYFEVQISNCFEGHFTVFLF